MPAASISALPPIRVRLPWACPAHGSEPHSPESVFTDRPQKAASASATPARQTAWKTSMATRHPTLFPTSNQPHRRQRPRSLAAPRTPISERDERLRRRQLGQRNLNHLVVTARLFVPVSLRAVRKFRRHSPMACTPVMVRGRSSGDSTSMKMAKALTLDTVHSHFCTNNRNRYGRWVIRPDAL
jgi:hypothetical protein